MDIEDLRAFVEVAEAQSVTAASRRLGVSKSVTSRRLARLETEVAAQLLGRTTRGVALSEAGAAFKPHAERMLAALEAGRDALREEGGEIAGRLRVSASVSFGAAHLGPALAELALRHPRLEIHASYTDRYVDLVAERFDAAIRLGTLADSSLVARRIGPIRNAVVASPGYIARHGAPRTPADLRAHAAVAQEAQVWRFRDGAREIAVTPQARLVADNGQALLAAAIAGVGVANLPAFLCAEAIAAGELALLLTDYPGVEAGLFVVRPPPAEHAPAKVRALTELMIARFGASPAWDRPVRRPSGDAAQSA